MRSTDQCSGTLAVSPTLSGQSDGRRLWDRAGVEELFGGGPGSVKRFLARWYGPPERTGEVPTVAHHLPLQLQAWYESVSGYSFPVTFHNTVLGPDQAYGRDGKLVFWKENQEVYEWAADLNDEDPLVDERATVEGEPWHPTGIRLSAFLASVAVIEAVMGAEHARYEVGRTEAERDSLLSELRPLPMRSGGERECSARGAATAR
jgi:hypothetical protein